MKRRTLHDEINNEDYYYEKVGRLWYEVDREEEREEEIDEGEEVRECTHRKAQKSG